MRDRTLHKSWQDQRSGWCRRVRWYQGDEEAGIRLQFEERDGSGNKLFKTHRVYYDLGSAEDDYELFIAGRLTAEMVLAERYDG